MAERFTCQQCGKRQRGPARVTVTGRQLCPTCNDQLTGLAAGMVASGGDPARTIATAGWFGILRRRRRGQTAGELPEPTTDS